MDWFERLTGFREEKYAATQSRLALDGDRLTSLVNQRSYGIGRPEFTSLREFRDRVASGGGPAECLKVRLVQGDVREMHRYPEYSGALFQVASQFNLLEMVGPDVTPEDGVTRYEHDRTQGPACAIAAGAATIYRNYFAPVDGGLGQTSHRQFDGLAPLGEALAGAIARPVEYLWEMRNGYALCTRAGLDVIADHLRDLDRQELESLRGLLCIGLHWDVEVTDVEGEKRPLVSQAFCSALPVAYTSVPASFWEPFASLVLGAAYEATMLAAILNARRGASNIVLLTSLGGGAFGNCESWIEAATRRTLEMNSGFDLDVRLVSYGAPSPYLKRLAAEFGQTG